MQQFIVCVCSWSIKSIKIDSDDLQTTYVFEWVIVSNIGNSTDRKDCANIA